MGKRLTLGEMKIKVYDLVKDEYYLMGEYVNASTKALFKHNVCGTFFRMEPHVFMRGHGCPYCYKRTVPKRQDLFEADIYALYGTEYTVVGTYQGCHKKVLMQHSCGYSREYRASYALTGKLVCRHCNNP